MDTGQQEVEWKTSGLGSLRTKESWIMSKLGDEENTETKNKGVWLQNKDTGRLENDLGKVY